MAATPHNIVDLRKAVQYDGTNSAEISLLFSQNTLSETGGVWTFESPPASSVFAVNTGDWIIYFQNAAFGHYATPAFDNFFSCNALCEDLDGLDPGEIDALQAAVATNTTNIASNTSAIATNTAGIAANSTAITALQGFATPAAVRSVGVAAVPSLLLGASATVAVTLNPAMPNTSFTARAFKFAGISLVDLSINSVSIVNASTVNVVVQNNGLITLAGASVLVTATK